MSRKTILITACILSLNLIQGQSIRLLDFESKSPIEGVVINVVSLANGADEQGVTDRAGQTKIAVPLPFVFKTYHLGYETLVDTVYSKVDLDVWLKARVNKLTDVVVTGQFNPQSASNSIFKVQTIDALEIKKRGAFNLQEALANQLNIRVSQDLAIGSSSLSLQGISSQNVKVLVDGVPLVNRSGNGNGADLSQINLQNIERIEIVEGPMAVNFGANALAGVINLISKKDFEYDTEISIAVQSETAGNEVGLDAGRHVQSVSLNHRFNKRLSSVISFQHNDFLGFQGNAGSRQHEWNPKQQWIGNALVKYQNDNHSVYYRLDILDELIDDFGAFQNNFLSTGENRPFAIDETYDSKRYSHQIHAEGRLPFLNRYTAFASFSDFERQKNRFTKDILSGKEQLTSGDGDQDISTYNVWEFGGTGFLNPTNDFNLQLGYQISLENVGGGRILRGSQGIEEYALYASAELQPFSKIIFRPGIRYSTNSAFGSQLIPSFQLKFRQSEALQFRFSYGRGFRAPSVRELYFEFIDVNHRIFGNPDLTPETSNHLSINTIWKYQIASKVIDVDLNVFYNVITNQISLGQHISDATSTTYLNVDRFKTIGTTLTQKVVLGHISANIGLSYIGRFNQVSDVNEGLTRFFYSPEFNTNLSYKILKKRTSINAFYKYSGRLQTYFTETNDQNEQVISIGEISDFHWLDATIIQPISNALELTIGARNIINVINVNNSGVGGGAHSGGPSVPISYGRSYFLKLSYNPKLK
ncbi:TonB-dependent receptor plug domain-containing protein [Roseivirga sp.]|uniref:TonB-dependent receptor plug domain-containing protein n=1 Tax=Roseivirga sp. TaxID=1964215 RepID=UPI003B8B221A